jgi:hypothetical protein
MYLIVVGGWVFFRLVKHLSPFTVRAELSKPLLLHPFGLSLSKPLVFQSASSLMSPVPLYRRGGRLTFLCLAKET